MSVQLPTPNEGELDDSTKAEPVAAGSVSDDERCRDQERAHRGHAEVCRLWPPLCDLLERWRHDAFRFDPEPLEIQTGIMAVALGVWLAFLPHQVAGRASNFSLMVLNLWPIPVWVLLFLLVGTAQILALKCRWLGGRCACAMLGLWLWLFVAALLTLEGLSGPSVAIFPVIALSEAWVYLRLRAHSDIISCQNSHPFAAEPKTIPGTRSGASPQNSTLPSANDSSDLSQLTDSAQLSDSTNDRTSVQRT